MKNLANCDAAIKKMPVCGRFAPTPSGDLHLGSLVTAVGSWLAAKASGGKWFIRIEDIDTPRCVLGADERLLATLASYALVSDLPVWYQSQRQAAYEQAWLRLQQAGWVYPCHCSRREVQARGQMGADGIIYDGHCRYQSINHSAPAAAWAWRCRVPDSRIVFKDACQGWQAQALAAEVGDFILRRADGVFSYHLAVVVDDAAQGVTQIVRGADLLFSTPRQLLLQHYLGLSTPNYAHLPLVLQTNGQKFSKQNLAPPVPAGDRYLLWQVLTWLHLSPPAFLQSAPPHEQLAWACQAWSWTRLRVESGFWDSV